MDKKLLTAVGDFLDKMVCVNCGEKITFHDNFQISKGIYSHYPKCKMSKSMMKRLAIQKGESCRKQ